jgi:hypothetical protein
MNYARLYMQTAQERRARMQERRQPVPAALISQSVLLHPRGLIQVGQQQHSSMQWWFNISMC